MTDHLCIDAYPPGERYDPEQAPLVTEQWSTAPEELAILRDKRWQTGQELRIRFMDGDAPAHERVREYATEWLRYANLRFAFGNFAGAEIRVSFRGPFNESYVGREAVGIPEGRPTMRLGALGAGADDRTARAVVLHEFGHAIGCVHEQASPVAGIVWDVPKVFAHYRSITNWDDRTIDLNVLTRYGPREVDAGRFDPDSIMQYPVPRWLTRNGVEIGWNTELSDGDKSFVARMYPGAATPA